MATQREYSPRRAAQKPAGYRTAKTGAPKQKASVKGKRRMVQLIVSAVILVIVVGVKLLAPDTLALCRDKLLALMGEDTDFVEAFSSVGRAVSGEGGLSDALQDAYTAVFGKEDDVEETDAAALAANTTGKEGILYTADNLPEDVFLTQRILGFAYADPVAGEITSGFGYRAHPIEGKERFHYGMDIDAEKGTVIRAFADGKVTAVGESSELGKYVTVQHGDNYSTLYAHCKCITASSGQTVQLGDPIAEVGDTGQATGPHLHFELHQDTAYLNPIYYVSH